MRRFFILFAAAALVLAAAAPALLGQALARWAPPAIVDAAKARGFEVEELTITPGWWSSQFQSRAVGDGTTVLVAGTITHFRPLGRVAGWEADVASPVAMHVKGDLRHDQALAVVVTPHVGSGSVEVRLRDGAGDLTAHELNVPDYGMEGVDGTVAWRLGKAFSVDGELSAEKLSGALGAGSQLRVAVNVTPQQDYMDLEVRGFAGGLDYGQWDLRDAYLDLSIEHLHAPTLKQLATALKAIADTPQAGRTARAQSALITALGPLILHEPEISELTLRLDSESGPLTLDGNARLTQSPGAAFIADISRITDVLEMTMELRMSEELAAAWAYRQALSRYPGATSPEQRAIMQEQALANLVNNGVLEPRPDGYQLAVDYIPGRLILNGQAMSLPDDFFSSL